MNDIVPAQTYHFADLQHMPHPASCELHAGTLRQIDRPTEEHEQVCIALTNRLSALLEETEPTAVLGAYLPLLLLDEEHPTPEAAQTVLRPDIYLVCDPTQLDAKYCKIAPDLVIEILTDASYLSDMGQKLNWYAAIGVPEYWVVIPITKCVQAFQRKADGTYYGMAYLYHEDEQIPIRALGDRTLNLRDVFAAD